MVQLVPVRVGLVHHRALQLHLDGGNGSIKSMGVVVTLIKMIMIIIKITS